MADDGVAVGAAAAAVGMEPSQGAVEHRASVALTVAAMLVSAAAVLLLLLGLVGERATTDAAGSGQAHAPDAGVIGELLALDEPLMRDIAAYRAPRRAAALTALLLSVVVPAAVGAVLLVGRGERVVARLLPSAPGPLRAAAGGALLVVLVAVVRLPIAVWSGIVHDGRWGFRTRSTSGWFLDHALLVSGRALAVGALVGVLALLVRRHPGDWPARLTVLAGIVGPLALLLHPLVVHPLLLPTGPLPDGPHGAAVLEVLARSEVEATVLVGRASIRTTRHNAVATGLGPTERIVLHDTLLALEPRTVAAIAAHELAHLERRDPLRAALAPVPAVGLLALAGRRVLRRTAAREHAGPGAAPSVRALLAVAALVLALEAASTPVSAALTRAVELRADVRGVAISGDPAAHVELIRTFVVEGLADPDPPRWSVVLWATHPTPVQRIAAVTASGGPATR